VAKCARLSQAGTAKGDNNVRCVISRIFVGVLSDGARTIGSEQIKGKPAPIAIYEYAPIRALRDHAL